MTKEIYIEWAKIVTEFYDSLENDLNTPQCIAIMHNVTSKISSSSIELEKFLYPAALTCFMWQLGLLPHLSFDMVNNAIKDVREAAKSILNNDSLTDQLLSVKLCTHFA